MQAPGDTFGGVWGVFGCTATRKNCAMCTPCRQQPWHRSWWTWLSESGQGHHLPGNVRGTCPFNCSLFPSAPPPHTPCSTRAPINSGGSSTTQHIRWKGMSSLGRFRSSSLRRKSALCGAGLDHADAHPLCTACCSAGNDSSGEGLN